MNPLVQKLWNPAYPMSSSEGTYCNLLRAEHRCQAIMDLTFSSGLIDINPIIQTSATSAEGGV